MTTRRQFLTTGGAALGVTALPWSSNKAWAREAAPKNLLVVVVRGGWDLQVALDPKPARNIHVDSPPGSTDAQIEDFGTRGGELLVRRSGPEVARFFEAWGPRAVVVRGIQTQATAHGACLKNLLAGSQPVDRSADLSAAERSAAERLAATRSGPSVLGHEERGPEVLARGGRAGPYVGAFGMRADPGLTGQSWSAPHARGPVSPSQSVARGAPDLSLRLEQARRRLLNVKEANPAVQWVGSPRYFDSHASIYDADPAKNHVLAQEEVWRDLHAFVRRLHDPGLSPGAHHASLGEETLVVVTSEMSRAPKLNTAGGKDHWPVTSMVVVGPGLRGGRSLGATSETVHPMPIDLVSGRPRREGVALRSDHLWKALFDLCVIDPHVRGRAPGIEAPGSEDPRFEAPRLEALLA